MVAIGYGGQDKGINDRVIEWMEADLTHRLVFNNRNSQVIDEMRGALRGHEGFQTGLGAVPARGIPRWREQARFQLIAKPVEEVLAAHYAAGAGP